LCPPEFAGSRRETAFIDGSDEAAQSTYVFRWRPLPKRQWSFESVFPAYRFGFSLKPWAAPKASGESCFPP